MRALSKGHTPEGVVLSLEHRRPRTHDSPEL
jgi:hypothetical protein